MTLRWREMLAMLFLSLGCSSFVLESAASAINVGSQKQLFIDKKFLLSGIGVQLKMNPPAKMGVSIIGEKPWELGWVWGYGSVLEDKGLYRMWYIAAPLLGFNKLDEFDANNEFYLCYAESKDGIHWEKPSLGIHEWRGSRANNIVLRVSYETATVFIDPKAPGGERYRLLTHLPNRMRPPNGEGLYLHTSPDGLRWKLHPTLLFPFLPDSQNQAFYDTRLKKYVVYMRIWDPLRKVGRLETDDILKPWPFNKTAKRSLNSWLVPEREVATAFGYDEHDPEPSDHYTSAAVQYPWAQDAYFMFPSAYLHYPEPPKGQFSNDGPLDIQMAVSRDGVQVHRVEREPYIELGLPGSNDSGSLYMLVGMLRHGDEIYQYYSGFLFTHGAYKGIEDQVRIGSILRVAQRLDGFVSVEAGMSGGSFITPPLRFEGDRLSLNLNASAMGELLVELQDEKGSAIQGHTFAECDPIHGNHTAQIVTWNKKPDLGDLASRPVRIAFKLRAVKLYAFQFLN